ncbi:hypothetical protein [Streptomyces profundus]|uniref:hypothetical protein n=1 Tax=Streptomyces profundus TaxID=2867410 RepID=UPI001D165951|nr:hypothetical protein [Streptomyces sp. MA3_2.13]
MAASPTSSGPAGSIKPIEPTVPAPGARRSLPLLGACGCGSGCSCGCQSGSSCQCGGGCG